MPGRTVEYDGETFVVLERPWARREEVSRRAAARHPAHRQQQAMPQRRVEAVQLETGSFDPRGYFVYLLFEQDATVPFYVGQSANIFGRLATHTSTYAGLIGRVQLIRCDTRADMDATERGLIRKYKPAMNRRGVVPQARR